jgi:hypothetical protein
LEERVAAGAKIDLQIPCASLSAECKGVSAKLLWAEPLERSGGLARERGCGGLRVDHELIKPRAERLELIGALILNPVEGAGLKVSLCSAELSAGVDRGAL